MTQDKCGLGIKMLVTAGTKLPTNWSEFLHVDDNKSALFRFLADARLDNCTDLQGKVVLVTVNDDVEVVAGQVNTDVISPCSREEAVIKVILNSHHSSVVQDLPLGQWTLILFCCQFHSISN